MSCLVYMIFPQRWERDNGSSTKNIKNNVAKEQQGSELKPWHFCI